MAEAFHPELPPLRDVMQRYRIAARQSLGQHFLFDGNLTARIARAAGSLTDTNVIEVGPGPGGLTRALLATEAAHVFAIERDPRCAEALGELALAYPKRLTVIEGDALELDPESLAPPPRKIVANLPYNISTLLLRKWIGQAHAYNGLTLMFQKEVAARLAALPGTKAYGRLTIITQWLLEVRLMFHVPPAAFTPPPNVTSTVVGLSPRAKALAPADLATLERVTSAAFGQRRKMLRSSLKTLQENPTELLVAAGLEPTARAEELSIEDFCALARVVEHGAA